MEIVIKKYNFRMQNHSDMNKMPIFYQHSIFKVSIFTATVRLNHFSFLHSLLRRENIYHDIRDGIRK